jgi:hypothetical protein
MRFELDIFSKILINSRKAHDFPHKRGMNARNNKEDTSNGKTYEEGEDATRSARN